MYPDWQNILRDLTHLNFTQLYKKFNQTISFLGLETQKELL
jgi:hypothetical protein